MGLLVAGAVLLVLLLVGRRRHRRAASDRALLASLGRVFGVSPRYGSPASLGHDVLRPRLFRGWFILLCVVAFLYVVIFKR